MQKQESDMEIIVADLEASDKESKGIFMICSYMNDYLEVSEKIKESKIKLRKIKTEENIRFLKLLGRDEDAKKLRTESIYWEFKHYSSDKADIIPPAVFNNTECKLVFVKYFNHTKKTLSLWNSLMLPYGIAVSYIGCELGNEKNIVDSLEASEELGPPDCCIKHIESNTLIDEMKDGVILIYYSIKMEKNELLILNNLLKV